MNAGGSGSCARMGAGAAVLLIWLMVPVVAQAMWMRTDEPVPVERLIANIERHIEENPRDARGYYVLGRVHSLLYARDAEEVEVVPPDTRFNEHPTLPDFASYQSPLVRRQRGAGELGEAGRRHLAESIRNYRQATRLAADEAHYWLGLGWMLEQAALHARPEDERPEDGAKPARPELQREALDAYRKAHELALERDLEKRMHLMGGSPLVSREAAYGAIRMLGRLELAEEKADEVAGLRADIERLDEIPMAITPIIFGLEGESGLDELLCDRTVVSFDLAGDGRERNWPWVRPQTGILVWDPEASGEIVSGRQLFGSVTWWMFWENGYQALAALDDDGDGHLTGEELRGLAVWRDANGNGMSDPGEVTPVADLGIERIAVEPAGRSEGVYHHPEGVHFSDGRRLPTYDWTPRSLVVD